MTGMPWRGEETEEDSATKHSLANPGAKEPEQKRLFPCRNP